MEFSGKPKTYLWVSIFGAIAFNLFLYLSLAAILVFGHDQTWILGWKPILITALFIVFLARVSYRWTMRLDAQFGTGKGWALISQSVRLPEPVHRK